MRLLIYTLVFCFFLCKNESLAQQLPPPFEALYQEGMALYANQEFTKATVVFDKLIQKGKTQNKPQLLANIYYQLGVFYDGKKISNKALEYLFHGVELLSQKPTAHSTKTYFIATKDVNKKWGLPYATAAQRDEGAALIAFIYLRIGGVYYNQEDYPKAEKYWSISYDFAKANQQLKALSSALNNLGEIFRLNNNLAKALPLYIEALAIKKSIPDSFGIGINYTNIGYIYLKTDKLDSAKHYYNLASEVAAKINKPYLTMSSYENFALYYSKMKQWKKATQYYQKALVISQETQDVNFTLKIFTELALLYEQQAIIDSALIYQKKWIALNKEVSQQKKEKMALEIEAQYLLSEVEKELDFLKEKAAIEAQNTQLTNNIQFGLILGLFGLLAFMLLILWLRNRNSKKLKSHIIQINQQNKEKDTLLKEIHHRVKNNLQVVTSLLSLQSYNIEDPDTKEIFSYSQYRIQAMGIVHEMLYQSDNLSKIDYKDYLHQLIESLITSIKGTTKNIEVHIDAPNIFLNLDTAIPLGLLINEVLTNSLKHGIKGEEKGALSLKIYPLKMPNYKLEIGDNGPGYLDHINHKTTSSLGLKLIHKLAKQLNGKIEKDASKKGTNYILTFQEVEQTL